jgi:hypothetical protein
MSQDRIGYGATHSDRPCVRVHKPVGGGSSYDFFDHTENSNPNSKKIVVSNDEKHQSDTKNDDSIDSNPQKVEKTDEKSKLDSQVPTNPPASQAGRRGGKNPGGEATFSLFG